MILTPNQVAANQIESRSKRQMSRCCALLNRVLQQTDGVISCRNFP